MRKAVLGARLAKFSPPRLHAPLLRERLFERFDRLRDYPCVWIVGPPGAGKTTAVASYIDSRGLTAFWYHVDSGDADPSSLFYYLGLLAQARAPRRRPLQLLAPEYASDLAGFSRRYFREFFERLPTGALLLLDNWQEAESAALNTILTEAITQAPHGVNLMVISRQEPAAALSGLVAKRSLIGLARTDLGFTLDETRALCATQYALPDHVIEQLYSSTDGWAAGLTLMLESMRRTGHAPFPFDDEVKGSVFDYFASQIFERTTSDVQETLLATAFLPHITAALAQRLSGNAEAAQLLEALFQRQLFLYRTPHPEASYQYHALFREFLLARARRIYAPVQYRHIAHRAALLLREHGSKDDAFELACEAEDFNMAAELLIGDADSLIRQGRWQTVLSRVELFPETTLRNIPWLLYWRGVALGATSTSAAIPVFESAYAAFSETGDCGGQALACSEVLECLLRAWAITAEMDRWIKLTEHILQDAPTMPEAVRTRCLGAMVSALLYRQPCHALLPVFAEEVVIALPGIDDADRTLSMATCLVHYFDFMGAHDRAEAVRALTEPIARSPQVRPLSQFSWWTRIGEHLMFMGEHERSQDAHRMGLQVLESNGLWDQECYALGSLCQTYIDWGKYSEAEQLIVRAQTMLIPKYPVYSIFMQWLRLWLHVARNERAAANLVWESLVKLPAAGVAVHAPFNHPVIVHLIDRGETDAALERIRGWRAATSGMRSFRLEYEFDVMEAYGRLMSNDLDAGLPRLHAAFATAGKHELLSNFAWVSRMMAYLCARALEHGIETDFVRRLIRKRNLQPIVPNDVFWPRTLRVLTLGRFAILRDDEEVAFSRKAPRRLIQMLKVLVAFRGQVAAQDMQDLLWPDLEGDAQHEAFAVNLHRLRKLLGTSDAVILHDGRLTLDESACWVDAFAFESITKRLIESGEPDTNQALIEQAFQAYRGPFLPHDADQPWALSMRERLRSQFIRTLALFGSRLHEQGRFERAITYYRRGIEAESLAEELYQGLMRCYIETDRHAEGAAAYRQLEQTFSVVMGGAPSPASRALGQQLLRNL